MSYKPVFKFNSLAKPLKLSLIKPVPFCISDKTIEFDLLLSAKKAASFADKVVRPLPDEPII